jgi:hypothetical protein
MDRLMRDTNAVRALERSLLPHVWTPASRTGAVCTPLAAMDLHG